MKTKFYDIESLDNIFTCTVWEPHINQIRVYYIDDTNVIGVDPEKYAKHTDALIQGSIHERISKAILENNPKLTQNNAKPPKIKLIDLQNVDGLIYFMRDMYVTSTDIEDRKAMNLLGDIFFYSAEEINPEQVLSSKRIQTSAKTFIKTYNDQCAKRTKPIVDEFMFSGIKSDTDENFDEDETPYLFGYNSYNYDSTMIAYVIWALFVRELHKEDTFGIETTDSKGQNKRTIRTKLSIDTSSNNALTAKEIRRFNNMLFSEELKSRMFTATRLLKDTRGIDKSKLHREYRERYDACIEYLENENKDIPIFNLNNDMWLNATEASNIRDGMIKTGLHIDVAKLNEKQQHVALKRLLGMLGYQIFESDKLHGDVTSVSTTEEVDELIAYNVSDVVYLESLFHDRVYASSFDLKNNMLKTYPELIYETDKEELTRQMDKARKASNNGSLEPEKAREISTKYLGQREINGTRSVRPNRLYADSSSQQLASRALSPLTTLNDKRTVSLMYPAPEKAADTPKKRPFNVLEDAKDFFLNDVLSKIKDEKLHDEAYENFMHVYRAYARICDLNFNDSKAYKEQNPNQSTQYLKDVAADLPWCLPYYDGNGNETSYFAVFSTGGVHGAEFNKELYEADLHEAQQQLDLLTRAKNYFGDNDEGAIALRNNVKRLKDPLHLCPLGEEPDEDEWGDGQEHFVKEFLKSGATKTRASWREVKMPSLWADTACKVQEITDDGKRVFKIETDSPTQNPLVYIDNNNIVYAISATTNNYVEIGTEVWEPLDGKADTSEHPRIYHQVYIPSRKVYRRILDPHKVSSCKRALKKRYTFTSAAYTNHEDFSSYYPSLLRMMNVFFNSLLGYDRYGEIYLDKERFGKMMKDMSRSEEERLRLALDRNGVKLILNTASGAGDAKFDNPIRMNNNIIAMRMIGQLFTWKIGQAQALEGAGVPSTNTDGLYTIMEEEKNNKLLDAVAKDIGVLIEPEPMHLISKDSNNRLEFMILPAESDEERVCTGIHSSDGTKKYGYAWFSCDYTDENGIYHKPKWVETKYGEAHALPDDEDIPNEERKNYCEKLNAKFKVLSASGGTLACRRGPDMTKSLAHPAVMDWALSEYLMRTYLKHDCEQKSMSQDFDATLGEIIIEEARNETDTTHMLMMFQNVLASNPASYNFIFYQDVSMDDIEKGNDDPGDAPIGFMQHYNRVFVMNDDTQLETHHLWSARARIIPAPTMASRQRKKAADSSVQLVNKETTPYYVLSKSVTSSELAELAQTRDIIRQKVTQIEPEWNMLIENSDLWCMSDEDKQKIHDGLNVNAYTYMLENSYTENWKNIIPAKEV